MANGQKSATASATWANTIPTLTPHLTIWILRRERAVWEALALPKNHIVRPCRWQNFHEQLVLIVAWSKADHVLSAKTAKAIAVSCSFYSVNAVLPGTNTFQRLHFFHNLAVKTTISARGRTLCRLPHNFTELKPIRSQQSCKSCLPCLPCLPLLLWQGTLGASQTTTTSWLGTTVVVQEDVTGVVTGSISLNQLTSLSFLHQWNPIQSRSKFTTDRI